MIRSPDARKAAFGRFVRRQLDAARTRGLTVPKVAKLAGIGANTIYRWRDGNWTQGPLADQIVAFCDALDIPVEQAFRILWPGKADRPTEPEPPPMDPDIVAILRKLADPNTPPQDVAYIRRLLQHLSDMPSPPKRPGPGRKAS